MLNLSSMSAVETAATPASPTAWLKKEVKAFYKDPAKNNPPMLVTVQDGVIDYNSNPHSGSDNLPRVWVTNDSGMELKIPIAHLTPKSTSAAFQVA